MKLIDTATAALLIGCSRSHVHKLVHDGVLTNHGSRKPWRLDFEEIGKAIDDGRIAQPNARKSRKTRHDREV